MMMMMMMVMVMMMMVMVMMMMVMVMMMMGSFLMVLRITHDFRKSLCHSVAATPSQKKNQASAYECRTKLRHFFL